MADGGQDGRHQARVNARSRIALKSGSAVKSRPQASLGSLLLRAGSFHFGLTKWQV